METTKKLLALSILIGLGATGCGGKNVTGSYTGTDVQVASTTTPTTGSPYPAGYNNSGGSGTVTLQITESNSSVTGTWNETETSSGYAVGANSNANANASASVMATFDGNSNLQISNMILPFDGYNCVYSGTLTFNPPSLSGSLNGTQTSGTVNSSVNICPVRNITLSQTSTSA